MSKSGVLYFVDPFQKGPPMGTQQRGLPIGFVSVGQNGASSVVTQ